MSEISDNHIKHVNQLTRYVCGLIEGQKGLELLEKYRILETKFQPKDILVLFDNLFAKNFNIDDIKTASNKLFNILFKTLSEYKRNDYPRNSILSLLAKDNAGIKKHLKLARKSIKQINLGFSEELLSDLLNDFKAVDRFTEHYVVMENVVFPEIERSWENHKCLKLMWSFHDDIRRNIKKTLEILARKPFDLKLFNETVSKVYFNISTIIFREEHILFPLLSESFSEELFQKMGVQLQEFNLQYADVQKALIKKNGSSLESAPISDENMVRLSTGEITPEQVELIINHLPVDITFVDDNNRVKFFSAPKHRIFPRITGIINRRVQDCHPHESVHVVEKIIESFRSGEKDEAAFWIRMGEKLVLIKYFAVRDKAGNYKGVLEVSQEISGIQEISGERRLLDW
jgi:DUF438 domain-containing protein